MGEGKLQVALYWGAGCGGCDVAVLDTNEFLLELARVADFRLWPLATDGKYEDIEALDDGALDLTLFDGAVRNSENEKMAKLLRRKSRLLVAFGSCAHLGGIPGLANEFPVEEIFDRAYVSCPSLEEGARAVPQAESTVGQDELEIPRLYPRVFALDQIVHVDYVLPGCPPAPAQARAALEAIVRGHAPPWDNVLGATGRSLCDECPRKKEEKRIREFRRPWEILADPELCLLEQGVFCCGSATRGGCGARCTRSGLPCRGCYGPPPGVQDQGARLIGAVASVIDSDDAAEIARILDGVPDLTGYVYRFGLPASRLERSFRS